MKVLMLGWEFPPHLTGGLGTACWGLSRALAAQGVDVRFVVPHATGDEDGRHVEILSADDFPAGDGSPAGDGLPGGDRPRAVRIESALLPYLSRREYARRALDLERPARGRARDPRGRGGFGYGPDLLL